ncbi:acetyl-CoA carboxylase biotin carboxyl carrier protein [Ammoniphilus sp. 3BR4]|uniref:acetyl-CoA carboxylase biotin carboxyl carrier protein n=1 Tax=Ammoniphilus sp. 3BR4 TaxID=3158265 RepID=UPI0034666AAF
MLKMHEIREIIKLLDQSSVQEFELENEGLRISVKKGAKVTAVPAAEKPAVAKILPAPVQVVSTQTAAPVEKVPQPEVPVKSTQAEEQPIAAEDTLEKIVSPMVGTFYSRPEPNAPSYVKVGDKVNADSIVCIVEAMKLFNEIEAEISGEIVKILAADGQLVEYGQPLFLVKTK